MLQKIRIILICMCIAVLVTSGYSYENKMVKLRKSISTLNLMQGLFLKRTQIEQMIPIVREAKQIRDDYKKRAEVLEQELEQAFLKLKDELLKYGKGRKETEKEATSINRKLKELKFEYLDKIKNCEDKLMDILTDNQIDIIMDFKPCIVPPRSFRNPVRIGQAQNAEVIFKKMRKLRKLPQDLYEFRKKKIIKKILKKEAQKYGKLSETYIAERKKVLNEKFDELRNLSSTEFELRKNELMKIVYPKVQKRRVKRMLRKRLTPVGKFLLIDGMEEILKSQLTLQK